MNVQTGDPIPDSVEASERVTNWGLYIQDEIVLRDRIMLVPGVRADLHSDFGWAVSPKLGFSCQIMEGTVFRAAVGRAFRAPTLSELFMPDWMIAPGVTLRSNPDLDPEYILAYDAGVEQELWDRLSLRLGVFYNDMDDLINLKTTENVMTYVNISKARSSGVEIGLDWDVTGELSTFGNYTFQQTEDKDTGEDLEYMPDHKANLGVHFDWILGDWELMGSVSEAFVGERSYRDWVSNESFTLDAHWRTDLAFKIKYKEWAWIGFSGQNVTDEKYEETGGYLAAGRLLSVQAGAGF